MVKINWNYYTYNVNSNFFKNWDSKRAYVLGFTCADGNVHEATLAWDLSDKSDSNLQLLKQINIALHSNYPIEKRQNSYRLRISNKIILDDIKKLGIIPNKSKVLEFPNVPDQFLRDFVRGFLDGDGWITVRSRDNGVNEISVGFSGASVVFMEKLVSKLDQQVSLSSHHLRERKKKSARGINSKYFQLDYYSKNAFNLIKYLYDDLKEGDLYLDRKFQKQITARKIYLEYSLKSKAFREKELESGKEMKDILNELMFKKGLDGIQIAKELNVHSSTIYRWLEKTDVRKPAIRGSEEWKQRVYRN
ncbi:MAG: hypothetical protein AABX37_00420 [Nanoarchaeota archaeon]